MSDQTISAKASATQPDIKAVRLQLGNLLKQAREKSGMSHDAVAQITKIGRGFVIALEAGEFEKLPGAVFGRGFVCSIARVLDLDSQEMSKLYAKCWATTESEYTFKGGAAKGVIAQRMPARRKMAFDIGNLIRNSPVGNLKISGGKSAVLLLSVPVLVLVVAIVIAGVKGGQKQVAGQAPKTQQTQEVLAAVAVPAAAVPAAAVPAMQPVAKPSNAPNVANAPKPAIEEPTMELRSEKANFEHVLELVVIEPVKIKLIADGKQPSIRQLKPDAYRFAFADRADLTVYDAAAVDLAFNGRSLGSLGAKGRIRRLIFQSGTPESAANNAVGETAKKL